MAEEDKKKRNKWDEYVSGGIEIPDFLHTPVPVEKKSVFEPFGNIVKDYKKKVEHQAVKLANKPTDDILEDIDLASPYEKALKNSGYYNHPYSTGKDYQVHSAYTDGQAMLEKHGILRKKKRL